MFLMIRWGKFLPQQIPKFFNFCFRDRDISLPNPWMLLMEETQLQIPDLNQNYFPDLPQIPWRVAFAKKAAFCKVEKESPPRLWWQNQSSLFSLHHPNMLLKFWGFLPSKKVGVFLVSPPPNFEVKRLLIFWVSAWSCWISNCNASAGTWYRCMHTKNLVNMQNSRKLSCVTCFLFHLSSLWLDVLFSFHVFKKQCFHIFRDLGAKQFLLIQVLINFLPDEDDSDDLLQR